MHATEQLSRLIDQKHQVLMRLLEVGKQQAELVKSGEISALLSLLGAKQKLIGLLQAVESQLKPHYAVDPESRDWPSPEARADCASRASACNAILQQIVELEKEGAESINARRNEVAQQLERVHTSQQVRGAYEINR